MAEHSERLEHARIHMTHVAKGLVAVLGPDDAIATLAGALVRVACDMKGQEGAVEYLRRLAAAVEEESPPPPFSLN